MSNEASQFAFMRGVQLLTLGRHEDAASFFRESIAEDISNAAAYANLARCLLEIEGKKPEALDAINQAVAHEPEESYYMAVRSMIQVELKRPNDALESALAAVALDPEDPFNHATVARAHMARERWKDAEEAARRALALDGDHDYAMNILATVLRLQGRMDENEVAVDKLLQDNPEDEMVHVNAGYAALQRKDFKKAEEHFREALRIDPEFEYARMGLIESFRARSWFYRKYLSYCFFMQRFTQGNRWLIILGIYFGFQFGKVVLAAIHPVLAIVLVVVYLLLVLWVWLARGLGNLIVMMDSSARYALTTREKLEGSFVGAAFVCGLGVGFMGYLWDSMPLLYAGGTLALGAVPSALLFTNESTKGRRLFGAVLLFVYLSGFCAAIGMAVAEKSAFTEMAQSAFKMSALAAMLCTWIGNVRSLRE